VELSEEDREAEAARKYEKKLRKAADLALEYDGKTDVHPTLFTLHHAYFYTVHYAYFSLGFWGWGVGFGG